METLGPVGGHAKKFSAHWPPLTQAQTRMLSSVGTTVAPVVYSQGAAKYPSHPTIRSAVPPPVPHLPPAFSVVPSVSSPSYELAPDFIITSQYSVSSCVWSTAFMLSLHKHKHIHIRIHILTQTIWWACYRNNIWQPASLWVFTTSLFYISTVKAELL